MKKRQLAQMTPAAAETTGKIRCWKPTIPQRSCHRGAALASTVREEPLVSTGREDEAGPLAVK
jgi:hypothetical protein